MTAAYDLGIEGGTLVTGGGRSQANVYVTKGRIAAITPDRRAAGRRVDAGGLLVMPGMVDAHVHFMDPGSPEHEDFPSGSAAAARAGVTTVIEHTHGAPVRTLRDLEQKRSHLSSRSRVDFALAAHAWPGQTLEVAQLWRAGVAFIKAFTCTTHGIPGHGEGELQELFREAARASATCLVHCEDERLTAAAERRLRSGGRIDGGVIPEWRSREAEMAAVTATTELAARTGARAVIAHASNADVLAVVARGRRLAQGHLWVETCPQYLTLMEGEVLSQGALRKFTPPARARSPEDLAEMWSAVAAGAVDYISSDHAPSTRPQKLEGSIWDVPFGLPGIDTTMSVLLNAAHAGRLPYEKVVELYSEAPARIYGLAPRKGRLVPGADADLVLVDPEERWTVSDGDILSRAAWSPFAGRVLTGRAVRTYLRGELLMERGRVIGAPGDGRFVPGPGADRPY
jgi:dihydroorotase (multifunctional complex type)